MSRENEKPHQLLMQRAEQVRSASEALIEKTRDWQLIKEFLNNRMQEMELTAGQQRKLARYQFLQNQLAMGKYSQTEVLNQLCKMHHVSLTQAYEDLRCMRELFSSVLHIDKRFELINEIEIAKSARAKCIDLLDFKSAAQFGKLIKDLLSEIEDNTDSPGDMFEGHQIEAVFDPRLLGAPAVDMKEVLAALNAKRKVPINIDMFPEVPFEDKPNE